MNKIKQHWKYFKDNTYTQIGAPYRIWVSLLFAILGLWTSGLALAFTVIYK